MNQQQIQECMMSIPFFKGMTEDEVYELSTMNSNILGFEEGERVVRQDEVDKAFYVVLDGSLSVTRDKPPEVFLAQLVPGSLFGELTLRADRPRTSSITADNEVLVFKVNTSLLSKLSPPISSKFKDRIIAHLVKRLDELNGKMAQFVR